MKASEAKLLLLAADLTKTQAFYSAVGIRWLGDEEQEIGGTGVTKSDEENPQLGLPHLWGYLGNIELIFYLDKELPKYHAPSPTTIYVYFDNTKDVPSVIKRLKSLKLFVPGVGFDPHGRILVLDPDGRQVELFSPNPFRL